MAFDITSAFKNVPTMGTDKKEIVYVHIDDILDDPRNVYRIDEIEELAASIELVGLQQPLNLRPDDELPAKYRIISGHRRKAAHRLLVDEGKQEYASIPSIIDNAPGSAAMQELKLIFGNVTARQLSGYELALSAERVQALFKQLKAEGVEFSGRMRDHVAAFLGVGKSTLSRVKVIMDGLKFEDTMRAFQENRLPAFAAYEIARRGEAVQELVDEQLDYIIQRNSEELAAILDEMERTVEQNRQIVADMEAANDRLQREAAAETEKAVAREAAEEYLKQRAKYDEAFFRMLKDFDFLESLPPLGISRKLNIGAVKKWLCSSGFRSGDLGYRGYPAGIELADRSKNVRILRSWPDFYDMLCAAAFQYCSDAARYPDAASIAPQWQTGEPERDGRYWCKVDFDDGFEPCEKDIVWAGEKWKGLHHTATVICWWPLPEG